MSRLAFPPLSPFESVVARLVKAIPRGQVSSYGQIAVRAGKPRGARAVVHALHRLSGIPWWRVIRSDGTIAAEMLGDQDVRLRREGIRVIGRRVQGARGPR